MIITTLCFKLYFHFKLIKQINISEGILDWIHGVSRCKICGTVQNENDAEIHTLWMFIHRAVAYWSAQTPHTQITNGHSHSDLKMLFCRGDECLCSLLSIHYPLDALIQSPALSLSTSGRPQRETRPH